MYRPVSGSDAYASRSPRVAHIVKTIEAGDEIEAVFADVLGRRRFETHTAIDAVRYRMLSRFCDGRLVKIETDEAACRKCFRHQEGGKSNAASHIGNFSACRQLRDDSFERR